MSRSSQRILSQVKECLGPTLNGLGVELVEAEYRLEHRGWVLRLYIDREGGVTLDDCQRVSEQAGDLLDVEDLIPHSYRLEVSSPGLDRPLVQEADYLRFCGKRAKICTKEPIEQQRNFQGTILGMAGHMVLLEDDGRGSVQIPYENIAKARLILEVTEFGGKGRARHS